jgi:phage FluMu protein Com
MVAAMTERAPAATGAGIEELRCKHRTCRALLARVIGATVVCLDGTRVGPVAPGMVVARACPRCKAPNRFWL